MSVTQYVGQLDLFRKCYVNVSTSILGVLRLISFHDHDGKCSHSDLHKKLVNSDIFRHTGNTALWIIWTVCILMGTN